MALVYVIAITMAVATLLVAVLVMTTTGIRSGARADVRNANQQTVQDAVQLYRVALESRVANEATGWVPPPRLLQTMLGARGEVVELASLAGLDRSYARPVPGAPVYAVRMQRTESVGGSFHFWQIIRVTGPGAGTTSGVTIWIRAWQGASDGRTSSGVSTSRVNFTPGGFQQFQLLTDGPIAFDDGARITGPVHSNGIGATSGIAVGLVPGARIDCAGEFARISVSSGIVADSLPSACRRIANGTRWNLGVVKTTFEGIRTATAAGGHGVMVVNAIGGGDVRVRLAGDTIVVGGVTKSIGEGIAVLVDGNVVVSGHTTGRVTIASDPLSADRGQIRVDGDLVGTGSRASIGLYTEGDVVVSTRPCVARIDAAIIAARGAMTIDRGLRTEVAQLDSVGCGKVELFGSIASAESPVLRWSWPGGGSTGYDERSYAWNPRLVRNPPPWTPVIEGWQANDLQEAGQECGSGGTWEVACG